MGKLLEKKESELERAIFDALKIWDKYNIVEYEKLKAEYEEVVKVAELHGVAKGKLSIGKIRNARPSKQFLNIETKEEAEDYLMNFTASEINCMNSEMLYDANMTGGFETIKSKITDFNFRIKKVIEKSSNPRKHWYGTGYVTGNVILESKKK